MKSCFYKKGSSMNHSIKRTYLVDRYKARHGDLSDGKEMARSGGHSNKTSSTSNTKHDDDWLADLETILNRKLKNTHLKIADLATAMTMSERSFRTKLKAYSQFKPNEYILEARLQRAYELLDTKTYPTVTEVAYAVGIKSKAYFSKMFKKKYGQLPSDVLKA